MNLNNILEDSSLANIDKSKLTFLCELASHSNTSNNPSELLPFILAATNSARKNNISFSSEEKDLLVTVLKKHMTPEEQNTLVKMLNIISHT